MTIFDSERTLFFNNSITEYNSASIANDILKLASKSKETINIIINSNGGSVRGLMTIMSAIDICGCDITTVDMGIAYSCAALLFLKGKNRLMLKGSELMFHGAIREPNDSFVLLPDELMRTRELKKSNDMFIDIISSVTSLSKAQVRRKIYGKQYWLTAEEALEINATTKIVKSMDDLKI